MPARCSPRRGRYGAGREGMPPKLGPDTRGSAQLGGGVRSASAKLRVLEAWIVNGANHGPRPLGQRCNGNGPNGDATP